MKKSVGEWNGDCEGEFTDTESILYMADKKSNGLSNLKIKNRIVKIKSQVNEKAECNAEETEAYSLKELIFNGVDYQPVN
jgi:hypothetical protein